MSRPILLLLLAGAACVSNNYNYGVSATEGPGTSTGPTPDLPGDEPPTTGPISGPTTGSEPGTDPTTGEADTGGTSGTSGSPAMAQCGDGVVEGDEGCDDGLGANSDELACTSSCQKARCGDGFVQAVLGEACDEGAANVVIPGYDQCSTGCARGAHCGDGVIQPEAGEECEPSAKPGEINNCPAMCRYAPRLVFLTSQTFSGKLGGLAGADQRCNELAAASLLGGSFRAWLLVDGQSLAARFPEFSGPPTAWNFTSMGNELLAKSFEQLVAQGPAGPLAYTEQAEIFAEVYVWTNISAAGLAAGGDCGQWTGEAGAALVGFSGFVPDEGAGAIEWHQERQWTERKGLKRACDKLHRLYCVQVSD